MTDLGIIEQIFANSGIPVEERIRAILRAARDQFMLGPIVVYVKDWRGRTLPYLNNDRYYLWFMSGVLIRAPMTGILPDPAHQWLRSGGRSVHVTTDAEHKKTGGHTGGFWKRERITSYLKQMLNDGDDYVVFNRTSRIAEAGVITAEECRSLSRIGRLVESLLAVRRQKGPSEDELHRDQDIANRIERINQLFMRTPLETDLRSNGSLIDTLLAEILLTAHGLFGTKQVLGAFFKISRKWSADGSASLTLEKSMTTGIPELFLKSREADTGHGCKKKRIDDPIPLKDRPGSEDGIVSWVAEHEVSLLIEDLQSEDSAAEHFPVRQWYRESWEGVRSQISVPVSDPSERRLYGVLSFESRQPRAFTGDDVYYLELFAQQAGSIIRHARIRRLIEQMYNYNTSTLPYSPQVLRSAADTQSRKTKRDNLTEEIANFFLADAVTIWTRNDLFSRGPIAKLNKWGSYYRSGVSESLPPESGPRNPGWTTYVLSQPKETAGPILIEVDYESNINAESNDLNKPKIQKPPRYWTQFWLCDVGKSDTDWIHRVKAMTLGQEYKTFDPDNCWIRVHPEKNAENTTIPDELNRTVPHFGFVCEVAVPLFTPTETLPIGVMWIKWLPWKDTRPVIQPTRDEMDAVLQLTAVLAPLIRADFIAAKRGMLGTAHELRKVWVATAEYAASNLKSKTISELLGYFASLYEVFGAIDSTPKGERLSLVRDSSGEQTLSVHLSVAVAVSCGKLSELDTHFHSTKDMRVPLPKADTRPHVCLNSPLFSDIDSHVPPFRPCDPADAKRVRAILFNLVYNAITHSGDGPKQVTVHLEGADESQRLIVCTRNRVRDEDAEDINSNIADSLTTGFKGLALIDAIARHYGGKIGHNFNSESKELAMFVEIPCVTNSEIAQSPEITQCENMK